MLYQQGDVLIKTGELQGKRLAHLVLARGEATGHCHILSGTAELYGDENGNPCGLRVTEQAILTHEEHRPVIIPPGDYELSQVREYDHFSEEVKQVKD